MKEPKDVTVLIVEDEATLRAAVAFDFRTKGFNVLVANNGVDAWAILQKSRVDIILSDIRMPGMGGLELLDKVRERSAEAPVVIFLSGFAEITAEEAFSRGADALFMKPFDRKALMGLVMRKMLTKDEAWAARKNDRFDVDFEANLNFPELQLAIGGRVLNIGRGGIFVALTEGFPKVGAKAQFKIQFKSGNVDLIEGMGTVRWVRTRGTETDPAGCGIEFEMLNDTCRREVIELINNLQTKALIPKG